VVGGEWRAQKETEAGSAVAHSGCFCRKSAEAIEKRGDKFSTLQGSAEERERKGDRVQGRPWAANSRTRLASIAANANSTSMTSIYSP
jgi:hypothetical protein